MAAINPWSNTAITFNASDEPKFRTARAPAALVLSPIVEGFRLTKVLMDGGSGLNLIYICGAVGERSRNSKFSYESPRSIYGETSNEGKESASTYPCRSLSGSVQENGVEGVVLVVIQITGDPSAERTAPPRSTHVQPGDVSHALIQQGERERLRKTPSSSSTTALW